MQQIGQPRHELAQTLSTVARQLESEHGEQETLAAIVRAAVETVPGVVSGGVTQVVKGRKVVAMEPSDELVRQCDQTQDELKEGPCMDAIWHQQTVIVPDLATETRWLHFAATAVELGAGPNTTTPTRNPTGPTPTQPQQGRVARGNFTPVLPQNGA